MNTKTNSVAGIGKGFGF